jgi:MFS transporter, NNP family, nitrate/nitrite transporter
LRAAVITPGDVAALFAVRFFISFSGATFVTTSLWSSTMFAHTVVGLAIATTAGWGNLGGGVTLAMHPVIFSGYKAAGYTNDSAWRCTLAGPPALLLLYGILVFCFTDDCPTGNFVALKRRAAAAAAAAAAAGGGAITVPSEQQGAMGASFFLAAKNYRTWIMALNYAFSFGIELVVNKNVVLYFNQAYGMTQYNAGLAVNRPPVPIPPARPIPLAPFRWHTLARPPPLRARHSLIRDDSAVLIMIVVQAASPWQRSYQAPDHDRAPCSG